MRMSSEGCCWIGFEATIYSWTMSGDPMNAGMHVHVAAIPYLEDTKISIRQPC